MKPIRFQQQNTVIAKSQDEYQSLPAYMDDCVTTSCWQLSFRERLTVLFTGRIWLQQMNMGERLQPQLPQVECPFPEVR